MQRLPPHQIDIADVAMAGTKPAIRKTKKSSHKPLSKLNEDNLAELLQTEKPEYTNRVFFYNTSTRARLTQNVNVWFRDHQHTMTLINRQQRAVCKLMGRVQKDMHRVRRDEHKRKQEEIRESVKRLRLMMVKRRVVQKFRKNAADKMAARGQESLAGRRLVSQRRLGTVENPELGAGVTGEDAAAKAAAMLGSVVSYAAIVANHCVDADDVAPKDDVTAVSPRPQTYSDDLDKTERKSASRTPKHIKRKGDEGEKNSDGSKPDPNSTCESQKRTQRRSLRRLSDPDSQTTKVLGAQQILPAIPTSKQKSSKHSIASREGFLDIIPEITSPTCMLNSPINENLTENEKSTPKEKSGEKEPHVENSSTSEQSRVVEVRKNQPNSFTPHTVTRTRRATYATLPTITVQSNTQGSQNLVQEKPSNPSPDHSKDPDRSAKSLKKFQFSSLVEPEQTTTENVSEPRDLKRGERKSVSFSGVPSHDKAVEDAMTFLSLDEDSSEDGAPMKGGSKKSMAARVRLMRKHAARRRAQILDNEPLVQYYRSARGTLQPLLTEPSRRSFPLPSGRGRYQQTKLLREEHHQNVMRRHNIEKFFTDLFTRQIGEPKPPPTEDQEAAGHHTNALEQLLSGLRRHGLSQSLDRNSMEQLAKCQYLRVYDWDSKTRKEEQGDAVKLTSWSTAESQLRAGFLALNFTGRN